MANIKKITVNGTSYDVEDSVARNATEDIKANYAKKSDMPEIPTKVSQLENDENYANETYVINKIAEAQLNGNNVDLSGYVTKETGNASQIMFSDGSTFQSKLDAGLLKGDKGDIGPQGPAGEKGDKGEPGNDGAPGPKGDTGATGATPTIKIGTVTTGNAGTSAAVTSSVSGTTTTFNFTIPKGATGAQGAKGDTGATGPKGDTGAIGPQGPKGDKGDTGATGAAGTTPTIKVGTVTTGNAGTNAVVTASTSGTTTTFNFTIPKGNTGATGAKGDKGDKGDTGAQGPQGAKGATGPQGPKGDTGATGPKGADGLTTSIKVNGTTYTHSNGLITLPNYPSQTYKMPYFISKTTTTYKDSSNNTGFTIDLGISSSVSLDINNFKVYAKYNNEDLNVTYKGLDSSGSKYSLWGVIDGYDANLSITVSVIILYYGEQTTITEALNKLFTSFFLRTNSINSSNLLDSNGAYMIDDFSSGTIDSNKWSYELGYVRNGETQRYTNTNTAVNNGILALRGLKDSNGNWTSASIISKGHFAFMYGRIEARVKPCNYNGSFGAFWTLGDSFEFEYNEWSSPNTLGEWWAYCGEFDVMEFYSGKLTCGIFFNEKDEAGRIWYNNYSTNDWHIFAMEWNTDGSLKFYIDDNLISTTSATNNRAFHIPHFILLNQAIGASGGTPDSGTTEITQYVDWVKYYPLSRENVVLNSSDFSLQATDFNSNNCVVRPVFNDNCINKSLTWSSSNSSIITVHSGFCCTTSGSANGTVTITATSHSGASRSITLKASNGAISQ